MRIRYSLVYAVNLARQPPLTHLKTIARTSMQVATESVPHTATFLASPAGCRPPGRSRGDPASLRLGGENHADGDEHR